MRVLILGHWDLSAEDLSGTGGNAEDAIAEAVNGPAAAGGAGPNYRALESVKRGLVTAVARADETAGRAPTKRVEVRCLPFGPASALLEALEPYGPTSGTFLPLIHGRREASTVALGSELRDLDEFKGTVVVEGGHTWNHDWGIGMLGALVGDTTLTLQSDPDHLHNALSRARDILRPLTLVYAASTERPLFGPGGTSVLLPDLSMRGLAGALSAGLSTPPTQAEVNQDDQAAVAKWRAILAETYEATTNQRQSLGGADLNGPGQKSQDPGTLEGSGSGGGAAALFAALGVPVVPTAVILATALDLERLLQDTDLVVVLEPHLDGPELGDSALDYLTSLSANESLPVVVVAARSSLSSPERAEWGVHGVSLLRKPRSGLTLFEDAGRRIGQTWVPHN